jgi:hypothetical protein
MDVSTFSSETVMSPNDVISGDGLTADSGQVTFELPKRMRQKVISASDAVSLVHNGDVVTVSGFVCQGSYRLRGLFSNHFLQARGQFLTSNTCIVYLYV